MNWLTNEETKYLETLMSALDITNYSYDTEIKNAKVSFHFNDRTDMAKCFVENIFMGTPPIGRQSGALFVPKQIVHGDVILDEQELLALKKQAENVHRQKEALNQSLSILSSLEKWEALAKKNVTKICYQANGPGQNKLKVAMLNNSYEYDNQSIKELYDDGTMPKHFMGLLFINKEHVHNIEFNVKIICGILSKNNLGAANSQAEVSSSEQRPPRQALGKLTIPSEPPPPPYNTAMLEANLAHQHTPQFFMASPNLQPPVHNSSSSSLRKP